MQDKQLPVMLKGSRYAERLPIGKKEVIETFKHDRLKKFYTDWYRPDLMAVIVVGDFDKATIEGLVKTHFGALPKTAVPRLRPTYKVPEHPTTLYALATDKEYPATSVGVIKKYPERDRTTLGGYRQTFVERLYTGMFGRRMSEIAQKADPPFLGAGGGLGSGGIGKIDVASLNASVKETGVERGLEAVLTESERVARFGFTATELDRQKRDMLRTYERRFTERAKQESSSLADEYVRNFTDQEIIPGVEYEYAACQRFLPEITLAEINALAAKFRGDANRVVMVSAPEKPGVTMPDEPKLAAVVARAAAGVADLKPWVDAVANAALMDSSPAPGTIANTTERAEFGVTEWTLSNGVKVVLKPTTNKADEVVFRAFSPGGTSLAPDADYIPASTASMVVSAGGVGKFSAIDLRNLLAGKVASASPSIGELEESVSGTASPKDLETLFQLIYLRFTAPRADPTVFANMAAQQKAMLANARATPSYAFSEALQTTLSQDHLRGRMAIRGDGRSVEPRQVARVLQGPVRRCRGLHVHLRRHLHARRHEAARREVPGVAALNRPQGDVEGRRYGATEGSGREDGQEGHRTAEPDGHRLHGAVPVRPGAPHRDPVARLDARHQVARDAPRGPQRDVRRQRVADLREVPRAALQPRDPIRLQPTAGG